MSFPDSRTIPCSVFFPTRKKYPKDANNSQLARHLKPILSSDSQKCKDKWHNLRSNCMMERRKSKEKIPGSGTTVKRKWPYYGVMNFWSTACSVELWKCSRYSNCN